MIDLKTIDENLAKAKADVTFWENVRTVFLDPRIAGVSGMQPRPAAPQAPSYPITSERLFRDNGGRTYGELRRRVLEQLPAYGANGITVNEIVDALLKAGYVFLAKDPSIAVNEALRGMESSKQCVIAGKRGLANLWTRAALEVQEPAVAGS